MSHAVSGLSAWWVQRLSALYIGWYLLVAFMLLLLSTPIDYTGWRRLWSYAPVNIATQLFFLALLMHGWVGMRNVILDYAGQKPGVRLLLLSLLGGWLLILGFWAAGITLQGLLL